MMLFFTILGVFLSDLLRRLRRWLTFRRVLGIVALLVLLLMANGLVGMGMGPDLPILFGLDWGMAIEVSALLIAMSVRDFAVSVAYAVKSWLLQRKVNRHVRRFARREPRSRPASSLLPPPPEDEPAAWAWSAA